MKQLAHEIIEALKAQPAVLALTVVIFALLGFIYYALHSGAVYRDKLVTQVLENSKHINDLMSGSRAIDCGDRKP